MSIRVSDNCQTSFISRQIEALRAERSHYVARVSELMRRSDRQEEVNAYLHLIDNINDACIKLARLAETKSEKAPTLSLAA